ncbi:hypothetical protein SDC9_185891 [bioreactor metagenome]|uniref:Uncharacterized protein n=1 Tax=bioreactor metagenome TaxID=1076179 RepID=A0A645HHD2_9ZZZZ
MKTNHQGNDGNLAGRKITDQNNSPDGSQESKRDIQLVIGMKERPVVANADMEESIQDQGKTEKGNESGDAGDIHRAPVQSRPESRKNGVRNILPEKKRLMITPRGK